MEHAGQLHVVDVTAPAGQYPQVLDPLHLGADEPHRALPVGGALRGRGRVPRGGRAGQGHPAGSQLHAVDDRLVTGAPAEVARELLAELRLGPPVPLLQQRVGGHHEAGRAEAALEAVALAERLLQRVQPPVLLEALDRRHLRAPRLHREHQARADGDAVDEHGARPAHPVLAPEVGPGRRNCCQKGSWTQRFADSTSPSRALPLTVSLTTSVVIRFPFARSYAS